MINVSEKHINLIHDMKMGVAQAYSQSWTNFKNLQRDGGSLSIGWPALPILPEPIPSAVQPGVIPRLAALAKDIKNNKNYTLSIGQDLWLIGAEKIVDTSIWKPILSVYSEAVHPVIGWTKGGASGLEILTDRGMAIILFFLLLIWSLIQRIYLHFLQRARYGNIRPFIVYTISKWDSGAKCCGGDLGLWGRLYSFRAAL